ncbi:hypothetical protein [Duganella vulcania]|uniref:Uncharacterized protein n=1 Tax=Duganella vulcania TaxID=2692166 RepID=A0A845GH22_9BURK|nr:hypothetical protein [Duganella vulcania]MYM92722.1 hypothetical protein [Duganella vulcania]
MSAQLNDLFLKIVWGDLQKDLHAGCLKYNISREIGEILRGLSYHDVGTLAANHAKMPLFELKHKDSASFWHMAADTASKSDDAEWSRITQHHALLMTSYPISSDGDGARCADVAPQRAMA